MTLSRRHFLAGASSLALMNPVQSGINNPGSSSGAGAPTGIATINGFQILDYPYKNFMKLLTSIQTLSGNYTYPVVLDANGYPTTTPSSTFAGVVQLPNSYTGNWTIFGTGQCNILLQCGVTVTMVSNPNGFGSAAGTTLTVTATSNISWSVTFSIAVAGGAGTQTQVQVQFLNSGTFSNFTNLGLCRASAPYTGDKAAIDSGILTQMFNTDFTNDLATLNPLTLRVIEWNNPDNSGNISKYANRTPVAALSYTTPRWDPNCIATNGGSGMATTDVSDAYSITTYPNDTGNWVDGETIQVQISASSTTSTPTFTVGARTPKTIVNLDGSAIGTFGAILVINTLATFTYDAVLDKVLYTASGLNGNQVPYEVVCALANLLNKNIWAQIPTHFDLASVNSWAAVHRDHLNSSVSFWVSYSNEMWNFAAGFEQTGWAQAFGLALGFPNNNGRPYMSTYSLKVRQFMPAVASTWVTANSRSKLKCILDFQAFGPTGTGGATNVYRLQSADLAPSGTSTGTGNSTYNTLTGSANYTAFPNRAVDQCDYLSYAAYYAGAQCSNFSSNYSNPGGTGLTTGAPASGPGSSLLGLLGAADAYAAGGGTNIANAIGWLDWDISQGTNGGVSGGNAGETTSILASSIYPPWETIAASYDGARPSGFSNLGIVLYEGGLECIAPTTAECTTLGISTTYGGSGGKIDNLLTLGYKTSSTFSTRVQQQFTDFMGTSPGRGSNHSLAPAYYRFGNAFGASQWSMELTDLYGGFFTSYSGFEAFH